MDTQDLMKRLDKDDIQHLWVIYHDYSGRSCAKSVPQARFAGTVKHGLVFARANVDFTLEDHQAAGAVFLADSGDFMAVPDPNSYAPVPYYPNTARVHAFMRTDDGSDWEGCPRTQLQRVVDAFAAKGITIQAAFEPEFALFESDGDGEYRPADADGMFTVAGLDRHYPLWQRITDTLNEMGVSVDQLGKEYGPGQYEATTRHAEPLRAVDNYLTFKEVVRALARLAGYIASFMPKPYAHLPGNGLHVHLSLWDADGRMDLSIGESEEQLLSPLGLHFVGGLLKHARALTGVGSPIVNSYKRLLPGSWAPAHVCWGMGNRAALVRVPGMGRRRHLEFRSGDNAANPFIFLTALLSAGLDGIENKIEPPGPVNEDVGYLSETEAVEKGIELLPKSLHEALNAFESDSLMPQALGPVIFNEFLKVKRSELSAYSHHVHPWERHVYLETI
ncbi:MAG: glutamine synthetase [Anaerolineales bacterium]|nr:glutamine synthetase [Anaerolineales bacterium]